MARFGLQVFGGKKVIAALLKQTRKYAKAKDVVVGYATNYAIYVHENMKARHAPGKQAKYLEQPARQLNNDGTLGRIMKDVMTKDKSTVTQALYIAGLKIQRESQKVVPVATGNLKGTAFTRVVE